MCLRHLPNVEVKQLISLVLANVSIIECLEDRNISSKIFLWLANIKFFFYIFFLKHLKIWISHLDNVCTWNYYVSICLHVHMCFLWGMNAILFFHTVSYFFSNTISWTIHFSPVICNDITSYITFLYMYGFISRFFILFCLVNLSWLPKLHNKSISGRVSFFFFFPSELSLLVRLFHKHFYNQILYVSRKPLAGLLTTYWVYKLLWR